MWLDIIRSVNIISFHRQKMLELQLMETKYIQYSFGLCKDS